jgi:chromosome segregation protein
VVSRKLFRSGESEYSINNVTRRLKDVSDLFLGTGVGNKAYSIMEQGRVSDMINAKPEEFRALIEEAAGISKYMSRKVGAERKLERTHQNLLRLNDIVREIERPIRQAGGALPGDQRGAQGEGAHLGGPSEGGPG